MKTRIKPPKLIHTSVKDAVKDWLWMARRYANGRRTYAPDLFNDAYDVLRDEFGDDIDPQTYENQNGEPMYDVSIEHTTLHPYAVYGDDENSQTNVELAQRKYYGVKRKN